MVKDLRKIDSFSIIGAGKLGANLAYSLEKSGFKLKYIYKKVKYKYYGEYVEHDIGKIIHDSDIIFISTGESSIGEISLEISQKSEPEGKIFFHTSNSLTSDVLIPIKKRGGITASLSPLQTFVDLKKDPNIFNNIFFLSEGDPKAVTFAKKIVSMLGGKIIEVKKSEKVFYHIAAVISSNFLISLVKFAETQLQKTENVRGIEILLPLIKETVSNIEKMGADKSLSGPVRRGETDIIRLHMAKLKGENRKLYDLLSGKLSEIG